ncbi:60s ribosomal protein l27 [Phaffia rhodozyma]|uniref:Large ribosomal subunit protein bL27m n=1 Tax=Phaffia rhodozyma TaxID=264483 RepID=A0A0F7SPS7_PHARH|nr:60s ribosomal protein l27 [Phaffia rhodozyma]
MFSLFASPSALLRPLNQFNSSLRSFSTSPLWQATKKGGGSTKNNRGSIGKRLGVKKFGNELVQPGDIIIRQRGTKFHPGQHVGMGRDHTLFALSPGYLKFYSLPYKKQNVQVSPNIANRRPPRSSVPIMDTNRPKNYRRYIGITLRRDESLPRDEIKRGRERVFWGVKEQEREDSVFQWVDGPEGKGEFVRKQSATTPVTEDKEDVKAPAPISI